MYCGVAQTSSNLCSERGNKGAFSWHIKKLMRMVDGGPPFQSLPSHVEHDAAMDLLMSVRGCGIFAPAVARYMGTPVVKDVLRKLLVSSARVLATGGAAGRGVFGIEQRKVSQKAECLIAFACLVRQVSAWRWAPHLARLQPTGAPVSVVRCVRLCVLLVRSFRLRTWTKWWRSSCRPWRVSWCTTLFRSLPTAGRSCAGRCRSSSAPCLARGRRLPPCCSASPCPLLFGPCRLPMSTW